MGILEVSSLQPASDAFKQQGDRASKASRDGEGREDVVKDKDRRGCWIPALSNSL